MIGSRRENRRSLRNRVDIAGKAESFQVFEEIFVKNLFGTQIGDVFLREFQIFDIFDDLVESCGNREASAVGNIPKKDVKIGDFVFLAGNIVSVCHSQLIEVKEHGIIGAVKHF